MTHNTYKIDIKSLSTKELEQVVCNLGGQKYRAKQIFSWIHVKKAKEFGSMTNIPKQLIEGLEEKYYIPQIIIKKRLVSNKDNTVKYLYGLDDGNTVEAVYMQYEHGNSLCISTQVGCKMGCKFCASTVGGFVRNLLPSEMLLQIEQAETDTKTKVNNVVLMGIGEPLDNFDNVVRFLKLLSNPDGCKFSLRNVTLSTCGLADKIDELAQHNFGLTLAVSLHAPNDNARNRTMPVNKKYSMSQVLSACKRYQKKTGRRVTYEYALIEGENDTRACADELGKRLRGSMCHVNLILVNEVKETGYKKSKKENAFIFIDTLKKYGVTSTLRRTLGADINAACGQLRRENL